MTTTVALGAAWAMSAVLLWAALEKARHPRATSMTVRSLGLPEAIGWPVAVALPAAELLVAVALLLRPDSAATQLGVLALALTFAAAGALALRLDHPVRCRCFGVNGSGYLGKRQLIALLPWAAGVALLRFTDWILPPFAYRAASFAAIAAAIAFVRAIALIAAAGEGRGDRRSAEETYPWLPSY